MATAGDWARRSDAPITSKELTGRGREALVASRRLTVTDQIAGPASSRRRSRSDNRFLWLRCEGKGILIKPNAWCREARDLLGFGDPLAEGQVRRRAQSRSLGNRSGN
jgi:hypothetical protein